jgi:hypothetical protein
LLGALAVGALVATGCAAFNGLGTVDLSQTVTQSFQLGPFNLAPMDEPGFESNATQNNIPRPAGAHGIKYMTFDIVDENGVPVSKHDVHLHHVLLMNNNRTDLLCPGRKERFSGAGAERTPIDLWDDYAYMVGAADRWDALWHVMNESEIARTVYIKYTVSYIPGLTAQTGRAVTPFFQDVAGCGGSTFDVPGNGGPGSVFTKSRTWTAPEDGVAIYTGAHLHEGGIDQTLSKVYSGQVACTSVVSYHEEPRHIDKITPCKLHHTVKAGHKYRLTSRYDNSQPYQDVMGINITYVWHGTPPE